MAQFGSTQVAKYNPKDLEIFRKEISNFGLEVQKFSRKGSPAARTLLLLTEPLELAWVGKGGKRNQIDLNSVVAVRTGFLPSEGSEITADHFPSDAFRRNGIPGNANLYVSLYLEGDDTQGRTTFDIQTATPADAKKFHSVLMVTCPNVIAASQVLVDFPAR
jgi:hypothetical protein